MIRLLVSFSIFNFTIFNILLNHCIYGSYVCKQNPVVKECDIGSWLQWASCSNSCGGGSQTRYRTICCSPTASSYNHCASGCNLSIASLQQQQPCGRTCINGNFNISQNICQCYTNYTGNCCQSLHVGSIRESSTGNTWKIPVISVGAILCVAGSVCLVWILIRRFKKKQKEVAIIHPSKENVSE